MGHAGLSAAGSDILCAAVSVLMENLEQSLDLLLNVQNQGRKKQGYHSIKLGVREQSAQTGLLMASTVLGMQTLVLQYPGLMQLKESAGAG